MFSVLAGRRLASGPPAKAGLACVPASRAPRAPSASAHLASAQPSTAPRPACLRAPDRAAPRRATRPTASGDARRVAATRRGRPDAVARWRALEGRACLPFHSSSPSILSLARAGAAEKSRRRAIAPPSPCTLAIASLLTPASPRLHCCHLELFHLATEPKSQGRRLFFFFSAAGHHCRRSQGCARHGRPPSERYPSFLYFSSVSLRHLDVHAKLRLGR